MAPVKFRGGLTCSCVAKSLPMVENYMLMKGLIKSNIDIAQLGYRTDVGTSKGTHAEGGCVDVWGQWSPAHIDVWRLCGWTMQRRDLVGVDTHAHGWPLGCTHLSEDAQNQQDDWYRNDAGLQGTAHVTGRYPIDDWQTAYTKRSREIVGFKEDIINDTADLAAKKVLAAIKIPSATQIADAVLARDTVPNSFTGNPKNPTVAPKTALTVLGERTTDLPDDATLKRVESKLDLLLATLNKPA